MDGDPCECVFNHETAMRRLLSLLRNSQGYCTDSECTQEFPGPEGSDGLFGGGGFMFMVMMLWMVMAIALFMMRPSSMRRQPQGKPGPSHDDNNEPPAPGVH